MRSSPWNIEINQLKKTQVFKRLLRDVGEFITYFEICAVSRRYLYAAFNMQLVAKIDDATVVWIVLFAAKPFDHSISPMPVLDASVHPDGIMFPERGFRFRIIVAEIPVVAVINIKIQPHLVVFSPVSP